LNKKNVFIQVIEKDIPVSYRYIDALNDSLLISLSDGRNVIVRDQIWGNNELSVSTEGIQPQLNNFLLKTEVNEDILRCSLLKAFTNHVTENAAQSQINFILKSAMDYIRFQVDNKALIYRYSSPSVLECVAVNAYTMESNLYKFLNQDLRSPYITPENLEYWKPFLFLFLSAIKKMNPISNVTVYRGLRCIIYNYQKTLSPEREEIYWYTISSTSLSEVAARRLIEKSQQRMLFKISVCEAYSISGLSKMPSENELIFIPGSRFTVTLLDIIADNFVEVHMQQLPSAIYFM